MPQKGKLDGVPHASPARASSSPRLRVGASPRGTPAPSKGEANDKYLAYMKALRVANQKVAAAEAAQSSPAPNLGAGKLSVSLHRSPKPPTPRDKISTLSKCTRGEVLVTKTTSSTVGTTSPQTRTPEQEDSFNCPDPGHSDSSDSIDFEIRSIGHVRSVKKPALATRAFQHPELSSASTPDVAHDFCELKGRFLAVEFSKQDKASSTAAKMGKGEGVVLEADVGFKDGQGTVFSPHGSGDDRGSHNASHVEEEAQVKASRKIAELELLKRSLDQVTTPTSKEMESASKFKNARDDLKASLSSIKAGLAASNADDGSPDARHVSTKVRNQLSMLHDAVSQQDDDEDEGEAEAEERNTAGLQATAGGIGSRGLPAQAQTGQVQPHSAKKEELKAKLQRFQSQLRIAKKLSLAREADDDEAPGGIHDGTGGDGLVIHSGAGQAELQVGENIVTSVGTKPKLAASHHARNTSTQLLQDLRKSVENINNMEAEKQVDASGTGSAGAMSDAPLDASGVGGEGRSSPYAGVFPASDHFYDDDGHVEASTGSSIGGTKRAGAKNGEEAKVTRRQGAGGDGRDVDGRGSYDDGVVQGPVEEEDPMMLAEERLRLAYSYAGTFAVGMGILSLCCFIFGIFMPFGFSVWAISVPLLLASVYFRKYCYPLAIGSDSAMPQSLAWVSIAVVVVASFLFVAGILSASASLSIAPIIGTGVCTGNIPQPVNITSSAAVQVVAAIPASLSNVSEAQDTGNGTTSLPQTTSTARQNTSTRVVKSVVKGPLHALSGLDAQVLMNFGGCRAWGMCGSRGIKMLTCSKLKAMNDWNAVFFFLSALLIPPAWLWIYYVITIRLQENAAAATTGYTDVLDCSLPACWGRIMELMRTNADDEGGWDEENSTRQQQAPKFNSDGPYSAALRKESLTSDRPPRV